jgi:hypothetical protein
MEGSLWTLLISSRPVSKHGPIDNSCFWLADFLKSSLLKHLSQMNRNLAGSIYRRSSIKNCSFRPDPFTNMAATGHSCFLLADFLKSSLLKPLSQMNRNLAGSIYWRSSIKCAHFVPIRLQTWPPQAILVFDWLISKKSYPLKPRSQINWNMVGSTYGTYSIKNTHFFPIH